MADSKITALTAISTVDPTADPLVIVDVSDTSMAASGTTKKSTINQLLGAGGTATLASATLTGALTVDTTTLVANAAGYADRVGIGTATPGAALEVSGSATNVFIRSTDTNDSALRYYVNGTEVAVCRGKNGNSYAIETAGAESFRINSTGNIVLKGGTAAANGVGVTFPATQVDSSDANCLDDYEEGTWTPVVADATTGGNVGTITINSATYTKIGRQVSIQCDLRSITTTGMTGGNNLFIRGLPFASVKGGNGSFYTYRVGRNASTVSSAVTVEHGVSHAFLSLFTTSSANTNLSILVSDITSGTSELALSVTYTV